MEYYKIIQDNTFIGIVTSYDFVAYSDSNHMFIGANTETGDLVECNDKLYRALWMKPLNPNIHLKYEIVDIIEITRNEYLTFYNAIQKKEQIDIEVQENEPITYTPTISPEMGIDYIRETKLLEMSNECRKAIENGFNLAFRSKVQHFSLTIQDQLNLMSLSTMAQTQELIPYHADGEEVVFYTVNEFNHIISAANQHKIYHTTYYNALKAYINSLDTIEDIAAVTYGMEIPEEYQTEVLKALNN